MGYWCTLHLFDNNKFYNEIVPQLKGKTEDLTNSYLEFLRSYTGERSHFSIEESANLVKEIISISNSFDQTFKIHSEFHKIKDYDNERYFLAGLQSHDYFIKFFEFYLFKTCADFFPHLGLGKGGILRNFNLNRKTLSYNIIGELDSWNNFFSSGIMGITNWITNEDVTLLYLDKENLHFENNEIAEGFLEILQAAYENNLGLIAGVDMRESTLKLLPGNKLVSHDFWLKQNIRHLLFKL